MDLTLLTNDAKYLLGSMYQEYIARRNTAIPKEDALFFSSVHYLYEKKMDDWLYEDVLFACLELQQNHFIEAIVFDNHTVIDLQINTSAIALLEQLFLDDLAAVDSYLQTLKEAIPFI